MKRGWMFIGALVAVSVVALFLRKHEPPRAPAARVRRTTLISTLPTNGKVEPFQWQAVHAETPGVIRAVLVKDGQDVTAGEVLARISQAGAEQDVAAAEARAAESRSALSTLRDGGSSAQIADLKSELARAQFDQETAQRDYESLERLEQKQAATHLDVMLAKQRLDAAGIAIRTTTQRLSALVGANEVAGGRARVAESDSAAAAARAKLGLNIVRSPIGGVVYDLPARPGGYVNVGDPLASVGEVDRLRVKVFVDEPELGRIRVGMPVRITWDGLPDRVWEGSVERLPTEIVSLNARQVGEVWVSISNPKRELVPGTTVNAEIKTNVAVGALVIPKAAVRHDRVPAGVFVLRDNRVVWQSLVTGPSDISDTTVLSGLKEGELILLPTDQPLREGDRVRVALQ